MKKTGWVIFFDSGDFDPCYRTTPERTSPRYTSTIKGAYVFDKKFKANEGVSRTNEFVKKISYETHILKSSKKLV